MVIAGVPVGGLNQQKASERLLQAYTAVPVEVRYRDAVIQIRPSVIGFELDIRGHDDCCRPGTVTAALLAWFLGFLVEPIAQAGGSSAARHLF